MTNLLIAYPDIPARCTRIAPENGFNGGTQNEDEDWPLVNSTIGKRWQHFKSASSASTHYLTYDLGLLRSATASFVLLSRLDFLRALTPQVDYKLYGSNDNFVTSTLIDSVTNLDSVTLLGPRANDWLRTFTASASYRYFQIQLLNTTPTAFDVRLGKVLLGNLFDFGLDPGPALLSKPYDVGKAEFTADSGSKHLARVESPKYQVGFTWEGVSDSATQSFIEKIYDKRDTQTVFLYTTSFHDILDSTQLLHVRVLDEFSVTGVRGKPNYNVVNANFQEVLG